MSAPTPSAATVVVVGSCNTDLVAYVPELPALGETVTGSGFSTFYGGKGANQAVAAALLCDGGDAAAAAPVAMVGGLGDDGFGTAYAAHLRRAGVDTAHVAVHAGVPSGVALIWVDGHGSNSIVVVPGANGRVTEEHVTAALASPRLRRARVLLAQLETPLPAVQAALTTACEGGGVTFLTPAPVPPARGPAVDALLTAADVLLPNAVEAEKLTAGMAVTGADVMAAAVAGAGFPALAHVSVGSTGGLHHRHPLTAAIVSGLLVIQGGARAVVVTLGSKGCVVIVYNPTGGDGGAAGAAAAAAAAAAAPGSVSDISNHGSVGSSSASGSGSSTVDPLIRIVYVPPVPVPPAEVVDTTGAGDAFAGALGHFYGHLAAAAGFTPAPYEMRWDGPRVHGPALVEAARRASLVAATSVRKKGAQDSYPRKGELPPELFEFAVGAGSGGAGGSVLPACVPGVLPLPVEIPPPRLPERPLSTASLAGEAVTPLHPSACASLPWITFLSLSEAFNDACSAALPEGLRHWGDRRD